MQHMNNTLMNELNKMLSGYYMESKELRWETSGVCPISCNCHILLEDIEGLETGNKMINLSIFHGRIKRGINKRLNILVSVYLKMDLYCLVKYQLMNKIFYLYK